jgi:hypothetical protein
MVSSARARSRPVDRTGDFLIPVGIVAMGPRPKLPAARAAEKCDPARLVALALPSFASLAVATRRVALPSVPAPGHRTGRLDRGTLSNLGRSSGTEAMP